MFLSSTAASTQTGSSQTANPNSSTAGSSGATQQQNQSAPALTMSPLSPADQSDQAANLAIPDKDFVASTFQDGMGEVQLGQLATQRGLSDDVKQFGQKMVDDHTMLDDQMEWAAQHMGVRLPPGISKKNKELIGRLQGLSGKQFDNAYIVAMVKDHKNDVTNFREEALQTQNPNLQRLVRLGSPVIEHDLQMIDQIAQSHQLMNAKGKLVPTGD
jgi:putative membrane protein